VAGKREIMSVVDPRAEEGTPRVFQSGTVNDGPAALASASAALREYQRLHAEGEYEQLEHQTGLVRRALEEGFHKSGIPCQVNHLASMLQIHLGANYCSFETSQGQDTRVLQLFYLALINQGVMLSLPTSNHIYFSFAHSDRDFELIRHKIRHVFELYGFGSLSAF
jgi:glutamate-1-semialdehyde aminotransferase